MAKEELSVEAYAKTLGVTRGTVYRWIYAKEKGEKSKLPKNVRVKKVIDRYVLSVKS